MRQLLVNADDFGLSAGITEGVIDAHTRGIVTSTSIIATRDDDFYHAVGLARQYPKLAVGLHLTLVEEPLLTHPTPFAPSYAEFARELASGGLPLDAIELELRAQLARCSDAGLRLTHLDSHQHVHSLPALMRIVVRLAQEHGIPRVRVPLDAPWRPGAVPSTRFLGKTALCALARLNQRSVQAAGLKSCDQMRGLFESGALTEPRLLQILDNLPRGLTELMCHPARLSNLDDDACLTRYTHWGFHWQEELSALTSPAVRQRIAERGIQLV